MTDKMTPAREADSAAARGQLHDAIERLVIRHGFTSTEITLLSQALAEAAISYRETVRR